MSETEHPSRISERRKSAKKGSAPDYAAKREELLRVAAEVFREKGYAAATLNDVAVKFGTDRASLYYYVGSKKELFQECVTVTYLQNLTQFESLMAQRLSPRDRLEAIIRVIIEGQVEHYPTTYVFIQEDMAQIANTGSAWAEDVRKYTRQVEKYVLDTLSEGVRQGAFRSDLPISLIGNSIFGMTQWTHRWYVPGKSKYSADDLIRTFSTVLFTGVELSDDNDTTEGRESS